MSLNWDPAAVARAKLALKELADEIRENEVTTQAFEEAADNWRQRLQTNRDRLKRLSETLAKEGIYPEKTS
jgi:hypothetical protein